MILPDHELRALGEQLVSPFKQENVQPASIDLTLDNVFLQPLAGRRSIDLGNLEATDPGHHRVIVGQHYGLDEDYGLGPQEFLLGSTAETIHVPDDLVGIVEGKSSLGRLGLIVHSTAGFCDPGFQGKITLEFYNLNHNRIRLRPGLKICQISFTRMTSAADRPYGSAGLGSKYQNQQGVTASRYKG